MNVGCQGTGRGLNVYSLKNEAKKVRKKEEEKEREERKR